MFQKRIIEIFTFVVYWLIVMPAVYKYAKDEKYLMSDFGNLNETLSHHTTFFVIMIAIYMFIVRTTLCLYVKCKMGDIRAFNNLKQMRLDAERGVSQENLGSAKSVITLDQIYSALATVDETDMLKQTPGTHRKYQKSKSQQLTAADISLPLRNKRKMIAMKTFNLYSSEPAAVHKISASTTSLPEYCIRKPAPPPPRPNLSHSKAYHPRQQQLATKSNQSLDSMRGVRVWPPQAQLTNSQL